MAKLIYSFLNFVVNTVENLVMSNPNIMLFVVKNSSPNLFLFFSKIKAVYVFHKASSKVPAYKKFLKENKVNSNSVRSYKDFQIKVPSTDKENYIYKYSIIERCFEGHLPMSGNIDESAGSSGKATMWVRSTKEEGKLHKLANFGMQYTFNAFKKNNLIVINCWSTGPWATGVKFSQLAQDSTVVKCIGTNKKNAVETIQSFGNKFEYLICGYPPFVKEILDYGDSVNLEWNKYRINILTGGEGFSENWRDYIRKKIVGSNGEVYSAYGASDIDIGIGFETDLTIKIKQKLSQDRNLRLKLLGTERMPTFFGISNPLVYHLENLSETGEILFTIVNPDVCSPKIRYNLKDSGKAFTFSEVRKVIESTKYKKQINFDKALKLPFFVIYGRSDGTISLDGANIYPNDVQDALFKTKYAEDINSFFIDVGYLEDKSMIFKIFIELIEKKNKNKFDSKIRKEIQGCIRDYLIKANKDYRESWENNPDSLEPRIEFFEYDTGSFAENRKKIKNIYYKK